MAAQVTGRGRGSRGWGSPAAARVTCTCLYHTDVHGQRRGIILRRLPSYKRMVADMFLGVLRPDVRLGVRTPCSLSPALACYELSSPPPPPSLPHCSLFDINATSGPRHQRVCGIL